MKLFLIGWDGVGGDLVEVAQGLKNRGHKILYWTKVMKDFQGYQDQFEGTIFHDIYDALLAKPAKGIDYSKFTLPNEDFLKNLNETELMTLTMMGKKFDYMNVNERRHLYADMVRYWYGVIDKLKPEMIIFPMTPHTVYDFVIYGLAKLLKIRVFMFDTPWIGDRLLSMHDYKTGSDALATALMQNKGRKFSVDDLSVESKEYFLRQTVKKIDATPLYMKNHAKAYSKFNVFKKKVRLIYASILDLSIFAKTWQYIYKNFQKNIRDEYLSAQSQPDFNENFVYVALHYQPEQTTAPLGGLFVDQILMIETLAEAMPDGYQLYVKEHPTQWLPRGLNYFSYRYRGYYKKIASIKNVKLVPLETDTFILINKSKAVATVTGTVAIEAAFRGKGALVFGFPWFQHMPGIIKVGNFEDTRAAFMKIINGFKATHEEMLNFLASFDTVSFNGYLDPYGRQISKITNIENVTNILNALVTEIHRNKL